MIQVVGVPQAIGSNICIKLEEIDKTESGIIIPKNIINNTKIGIVMNVGKTIENEGNDYPNLCNRRVLFSLSSGYVETNEGKFVIVEIGDVLAFL